MKHGQMVKLTAIYKGHAVTKVTPWQDGTNAAEAETAVFAQLGELTGINLGVSEDLYGSGGIVVSLEAELDRRGYFSCYASTPDVDGEYHDIDVEYDTAETDSELAQAFIDLDVEGFKINACPADGDVVINVSVITDESEEEWACTCRVPADHVFWARLCEIFINTPGEDIHDAIIEKYHKETSVPETYRHSLECWIREYDELKVNV